MVGASKASQLECVKMEIKTYTQEQSAYGKLAHLKKESYLDFRGDIDI